MERFGGECSDEEIHRLSDIAKDRQCDVVVGWRRYLFFSRNPDLVLVDTRVIADAPVRFLVAGMGDALRATMSAAVMS